MKILFVSDSYPPQINGGSLATQVFARELSKRKHKVFVFAPSPKFRNIIEYDGDITVYYTRSLLVQKEQAFRVSPQPLHWNMLVKTIQRIKPDIIHITAPGFLGQSAISIAYKLGIPIVGTGHFMAENVTHYLHLPNRLEDIINHLVWREYARIYSKLDAVIAPTEAAKKLITQFGNISYCQVISNGIDLTRFQKKVDTKYIWEKLNLPHVPLLLFVGRLEKEKNIDILLHAAAQIKNLFSFHIVVVGKGKELLPLKNLAKELGLGRRATFTGYISDDDALSLYKVASIFVMPSIAELQSLVTMDGMAAGLPVIAANAVALPHLVKNNKNGFLFAPGNPDDLAQKLRLLLLDKGKQQEMGKESLRIIKEHSMPEVIDQVEAFYKKVLKEFKRKPHQSKITLLPNLHTPLTKKTIALYKELSSHLPL